MSRWTPRWRHLSRRQREIIVRHYLEGFIEAELAACLHVSLGTVKKATSRAKQTLRRELGDGWGHLAVSAVQ